MMSAAALDARMSVANAIGQLLGPQVTSAPASPWESFGSQSLASFFPPMMKFTFPFESAWVIVGPRRPATRNNRANAGAMRRIARLIEFVLQDCGQMIGCGRAAPMIRRPARSTTRPRDRQGGSGGESMKYDARR